MTAALRRIAAEARAWLLDAAYPFWFDKGIEPTHGGFVDFVAVAKAHAAIALDDAALADAARAIFCELDRTWQRPPAGYWEGELPDGTVRRQNPHMHLFEAALAIAGTRWAVADDLPRAERVAQWLADHFFDRARGALPELFDADWVPQATDGAFDVEPGHHFEWAWLLGELAELGGPDHRELAGARWR